MYRHTSINIDRAPGSLQSILECYRLCFFLAICEISGNDWQILVMDQVCPLLLLSILNTSQPVVL